MPDPGLQTPHRRYNPLRRDWVLISPQRTQRPWQGEVGAPSGFAPLHYDPTCYLCPGNQRAGGKQTPRYESVYVFDNDYAALLPDSPAPADTGSALLLAQQERGRCRVLCFHPDHALTLALMDPADIHRVVDAWTEQYTELGADPNTAYVQIFENRGAMMGASNPHPHGQLWATQHVPDEPYAETESQAAYYAAHQRSLLADYAALELDRQERIVCQNDTFLCVVPWWAVWPFETLIIAKEQVPSLTAFTPEQRAGLADILSQTTIRYDNLFETSFPYTMGLHQAPTDGAPHPEWHFHIHFYPPLLRSATVKKFMVGFEMLGMPQRDITAEGAAERLRALPTLHFTRRQGS
ncbi:MAG TPA: UDP-glucose--hexose-1-phosphate uridylyltransferase [Acidobacteriaceae bacterium]